MSKPIRCLPLAKRSLLAFRGPDAIRYLNGQLTQDVRDLGELALPACVTDAKGRLQAYVHVFRGPDESIWIEGPADQTEELEARLTRYLIADEVEVEDLSGNWLLWHVVDTAEEPLTRSGVVRKANRIGTDGFDLWLPAGETPEIIPLTPEEAEARRIAAGIPAWGAELTAGMLPPEAGLDRSAISYRKGCYIGQEVLSRLKTAGKLNRKLAALLVDAPVKAGVITSASTLADAETGLYPALGYLPKAQFEAAEVEIIDSDQTVKGTARVIRWI